MTEVNEEMVIEVKNNGEKKTIELELPEFVWETLEKLGKEKGVPVEAFIEMILVMKLDDLLKEKKQGSTITFTFS